MVIQQIFVAVKWRGRRRGLDIGIGVRGGIVGRGGFGRGFTVPALRVGRGFLAQIMVETRHRIVVVGRLGANNARGRRRRIVLHAVWFRRRRRLSHAVVIPGTAAGRHSVICSRMCVDVSGPRHCRPMVAWAAVLVEGSCGPGIDRLPGQRGDSRIVGWYATQKVSGRTRCRVLEQRIELI
ncbi:hypothetical protein [Mycobacterium simiae]|uniref:hypothetical protein n=1 Tax=Mycobacterium simiae TaxID=1784 RepID=UPI0020CB6342|nr:hypothetical protein [Mycobacterium simiae]